MPQHLKGQTVAIGLAATAAVLGVTAAAVSIRYSHARKQPAPPTGPLTPSEPEHPNSHDPTPSAPDPAESRSSPATCPPADNLSSTDQLHGPRNRHTVSASQQIQPQPKHDDQHHPARFPPHPDSSKIPRHHSTSPEVSDRDILTQPPQPQSQAQAAHQHETHRLPSKPGPSEPLAGLPTAPAPALNLLQQANPSLSPSSPRHWIVFWDLENVPVPRGLAGHILIHSLRTRLSDLHPVPIMRITAVCNVFRLTAILRNQLQASGVTLVHVEARGRKDAADKALISDMCLLPVEHPPPVGVVLISGDADFAYALARMRSLGYFTVVVANGNAVRCGGPLKEVPNVLWGMRKHVLSANLGEQSGGLDIQLKRVKEEESKEMKDEDKKGLQSLKKSEKESEPGLDSVTEGVTESHGAKGEPKPLKTEARKVRTKDNGRVEHNKIRMEGKAASKHDASPGKVHFDGTPEHWAVDHLTRRFWLRTIVVVVVLIGFFIRLIPLWTQVIAGLLKFRNNT